MSLREQARQDFAANLVIDGDQVVITYEDASTQKIMGKIVRVDNQLDPVGVPYREPRTIVTCSLSSLNKQITDNTQIEIADSEGNKLKSKCSDRSYDRTLGFVSITMEVLDES